MSKLQNPFNQTDYLNEVLKCDINYHTSKNQAFNQFLQQYKTKNNLNLEPKYSFFSKLFRAITTHSTAFVLGLIITTGVVGANAAENYAPKNYKPSVIFNELFKINKQTEKNPYTKLVADDKNNVIVSDKCDIAIKYPKQIETEEIGVILQQADKYNPSIIESILFDAKRQFQSPIYDPTIRVSNLSLTCRTEEFYPNDDPASNWVPVNKDVLRKYTGWFIAIENEITDFKMPTTQIGAEFQTFKFKFKDKFYELSFHTRQNLKPLTPDDETSQYYLSKKGLFGEQIQIQFNSLIRSDSNILLDYYQSSSSSSSSSISNSGGVNSALEIIKSVNNLNNQSLISQASTSTPLSSATSSTSKVQQVTVNDSWSNKSVYPLLNIPLNNNWKVRSDQTTNQGTKLVLFKDNTTVQVEITPKTPTGGFGYQCYTDAKKISDKIFRAREVNDITASNNTNQNFVYYPISQFGFDKNIVETNIRNNEEVFGQKYNPNLRSRINVCGSAFETGTTVMAVILNNTDGQARVRITVNSEATEASLIEVDSLISQLMGITVE